MRIQCNSAFIDGSLTNEVWFDIHEGRIAEIAPGFCAEPDITIPGIVIPGFVDIHCHGGGGYYFSSESSEAIEKVIATHRSHGTTGVMASLVTEPLSALKAQISRLNEFAARDQILGIHLEGPYLAPSRAGAHDVSLLRTPLVAEFQELLAVGNGHIKMVTLAPEIAGAMAAIEYLVSQGVIVALGHTEANSQIAIQALAAGASVITHFNNATPKLEPGVDNLSSVVIDDPDTFLELIMDGHHVSEPLMRQVIESAPERLVLITDAMCAAGGVDGQYKIGQLPVTVTDGVARLNANQALAGSTLTMDRAFLNFLDMGYSLDAAIAATSTNAAKVLGEGDRGVIKIGGRADLLCYEAGLGKVTTIATNE